MADFRLLSFFNRPQAVRGLYNYIWRLSDQTRFIRQSTGMYHTDNHDFLQLVLSLEIERQERITGKNEVFIEGEIYVLTNDPHFSLLKWYVSLPPGALPKQEELLGKIDRVERALGYVEEGKRPHKPKSLLS